jgi:hypothetical protein
VVAEVTVNLVQVVILALVAAVMVKVLVVAVLLHKEQTVLVVEAVEEVPDLQ